MKSKSLQFSLAGIITAMVITAFFFSFYNETRVALGSTITGQDYMATTTAGNAVFGSLTTSGLIKTGGGAFGTLVITGSNTGIMNFYDATTTDITKRTNNKATSSILIASIPASLGTGDYPFDVSLSTGLYLDLVSGNMPTTTITFRN